MAGSTHVPVRGTTHAWQPRSEEYRKDSAGSAGSGDVLLPDDDEQERPVRPPWHIAIRGMLKKMLLMYLASVSVCAVLIFMYHAVVAVNLLNPATGRGNYPVIMIHYGLYSVLGIPLACLLEYVQLNGTQGLGKAVLSVLAFPLAIVIRILHTFALAGFWDMDAACDQYERLGPEAVALAVSFLIVFFFPYAVAVQAKWSPYKYLRYSTAVFCLAASWFVNLQLLGVFFRSDATIRLILRIAILPLYNELVLAIVRETTLSLHSTSLTLYMAIIASCVGRLMLVPSPGDPISTVVLPLVVGVIEVLMRITYFKRSRLVHAVMSRVGFLQRGRDDGHHSFFLGLEMIAELIVITTVHFLAFVLSQPAVVPTVLSVPIFPTLDSMLVSLGTQLAIEVVVDSTCIFLERRQGIFIEEGWNMHLRLSHVILIVVMSGSTLFLAMRAFLNWPILCQDHTISTAVAASPIVIEMFVVAIPLYHWYKRSWRLRVTHESPRPDHHDDVDPAELVQLRRATGTTVPKATVHSLGES